MCRTVSQLEALENATLEGYVTLKHAADLSSLFVGMTLVRGAYNTHKIGHDMTCNGETTICQAGPRVDAHTECGTWVAVISWVGICEGFTLSEVISCCRFGAKTVRKTDASCRIDGLTLSLVRAALSGCVSLHVM